MENGQGINELEIKWSRNLFRTIQVGGIWGVPRSGLIFLKVDQKTFALDNLMPWSEDMGKGFANGLDVPPTKEKLREWQIEDYAQIARRFEAAGINMPDPKNLLKEQTRKE